MLGATAQLPGDLAVLDLMRAASFRFATRLQRQNQCTELPAPPKPAHGADLLWRNTLFTAASFRRAHVEQLEITSHFAVLHVVVLPHVSSAAPIFGFDMISGRTQATGIFLDYSAVTQIPPSPRLGEVITPSIRAGFTHARARPQWGTIFSPDFFAIRPSGIPEIRAALALADKALAHYLSHLPQAGATEAVHDPEVVRGQAAYATAQRQNPHTERMLARYVGAAQARAFIDEVLFPLPV